MRKEVALINKAKEEAKAPPQKPGLREANSVEQNTEP